VKKKIAKIFRELKHYKLKQNNDSIANKKQSGLAILLGDEYKNESPTSSFESDPVLQKVDTYLNEKPLDREKSLLVW